MKVHVKQLFVGVENCIVFIDGIWLIDYANARTLNILDKIREFTIEQILNGVDASNTGNLVFKTATVADNASVADFSASLSPEKGPAKFTDKSTGSPTSWYWNFWKYITIKGKRTPINWKQYKYLAKEKEAIFVSSLLSGNGKEVERFGKN